jgi:two-component system CheB/CheR fusion protein
MLIRLGYDLAFQVSSRTPMLLMLYVNLHRTDVNRSIDDIKLTVDVPDVKQLLLEVIDTVQIREREVRDRDGYWHELRIHPYRTSDNKIDGAVMVLLGLFLKQRF